MRGLKLKNEVGALATSIIYELKAFSIAEFGINRFPALPFPSNLHTRLQWKDRCSRFHSVHRI